MAYSAGSQGLLGGSMPVKDSFVAQKAKESGPVDSGEGQSEQMVEFRGELSS